jgi:hypothetical protein
MNASGQHATTLSSGSILGDREDVAVGNISALAVMSLILGLASPLSLAAPLLWAIPLAGAVIAVMTIRRIALSDGALVGRQAAVIGLALSVASLTAAASRSVVTEQVLSYQARHVAAEWLAMLQAGDMQTAFKSTAEGKRGPAPPPPPGSPAAAEPPRDRLAEFRQDRLIRYLATVGKDAAISFDHQATGSPETGNGGRLTEYFLVSPTSGSTLPTKTVHVGVDRIRASSLLAANWVIAEYGGDNLPDQSAGDE